MLTSFLSMSPLQHAVVLIVYAALAVVALQRFVASFDVASFPTMLTIVALFTIVFGYSGLSASVEIPLLASLSPAGPFENTRADWAVMALMSSCGLAGYAVAMVFMGTFPKTMGPRKKEAARASTLGA